MLSFQERLFRAPLLHRQIPITSKYISNLTLAERGLLNKTLPVSAKEILSECNVVSKDTFEKHFSGQIGAIFPLNYNNSITTLDYNEKIDYFFPELFTIEFDFLLFFIFFSR